MDKNVRILAAVSGGVDSVYMLHWLLDNGYKNIGVAHFDHCIREDSSKDVELVRSYAQKHSLPFYLGSKDVLSWCKENKTSVELGARILRREFFNNVMENEGYEWVALAHNQNDQAETVLYNITRGSGVHGLAGMLAQDDRQRVWRPILHLSKDEIYSKARENNLVWNEDYTNRESVYDRNKIRNQVLPLFERNVVKVLAREAELFSQMSDFLKATARQWLDKHGERFYRMDFLNEHKILQNEILGLLWERVNNTRCGFSHKVISEVHKWLQSNPDGGSKVYFGKSFLTIRKGVISVAE